MHMPTSRTALVGLALLTALQLPLGAQERTVLSKEVAVARSEAALRLEFQDGERLAVALRDGSVFIDGEVAGAFRSGDALDQAFRALLGRAVSLEDGPLTEMLVEWSPPEGLPEDRRLLAERIDGALEGALTAPAGNAAGDGATVRVEGTGESRLLSAILGQADRLGFLEEALTGLDDVRIHVEEDVRVEAGQTVEGSLLVVEADAFVAGTVTGDVVAVGGIVELLEGGEIRGDVRLADAELVRAGGTLSGQVRELTDDDRVTVVNGREVEDIREIRDEIRRELREELRSELRRDMRDAGGGGFASGLLAPFRGIFRALGGILETLVGVFLVGLVGVGILTFAPRNLDVVAETARRAPGRAAVVGMAGTFLLLPVYVLGAVALTISIVGIPVLLAWLPLFPLAALAAAAMGHVAVGRNVGEWLSESGYRYTGWIRRSNDVYTIFGGLLGIAAFFLVAEALHIVPFSGFFRGILTVAGVLVSGAALMIGFGAVLLTRAGRRPEYYPMDPDEAWRQAVDPDLDMDLDAEMPDMDAGAGTAGTSSRPRPEPGADGGDHA